MRSVITDHRLSHNHDFQWDNVLILDEEPSYRKRLISEMLHIKKQKNSLNLQTDTEGLNKAYLPIINKVWLSILSTRLLSQCVACRLSERSVSCAMLTCLTSTITSLSLSGIFTLVMHCGDFHFLFGCVGEWALGFLSAACFDFKF